MRNKKSAVLVIVITVFILLLVIAIYMNVNSLSFSVGNALVAYDGQYMLVIDDSPVCLSNIREKNNMFDDIDSGDKILVLHDGIQETYPGHTGVYAVFKLKNGAVSDISKSVLTELTDMGWLSCDVYKLDENLYAGDAFKVTSSNVTYINDTTALYEKALNFDKMNIDSIFNIPIYKFETIRDAEDFIMFFENEYLSDGYHGDIDEFKNIIKSMDEEYFEDYTVFLLYVTTGSGATDTYVHSVYNDGENLCIHIAENNLSGVGGTAVMSGFFYTVSVEKESVRNCTSFHADVNNF